MPNGKRSTREEKTTQGRAQREHRLHLSQTSHQPKCHLFCLESKSPAAPRRCARVPPARLMSLKFLLGGYPNSLCSCRCRASCLICGQIIVFLLDVLLTYFEAVVAETMSTNVREVALRSGAARCSLAVETDCFAAMLRVERFRV